MGKRLYAGEQYLRSEHLLRHGRYIAVTLEIEEIVYNCPKKKMGGGGDSVSKSMIGLKFVNQDKILGLNTTNESLVALNLGEGSPENWIGKKIQLVVRLIHNKREKIQEPAIRVWPRKGLVIPNLRIQAELGDEVTDAWYEKNIPSDRFTVEDRTSMLGRLSESIDAAKTAAGVDGCEEKLTAAKDFLSKKGLPMSEPEIAEFQSKIDGARSRITKG